MRSRELNRWLERLASLTPYQREQVKAHLQGLAGHDAVAELLEERAAPTHCPGCQGTHWVRNGIVAVALFCLHILGEHKEVFRHGD